jgi:hypothetical protein
MITQGSKSFLYLYSIFLFLTLRFLIPPSVVIHFIFMISQHVAVCNSFVN